MRVCRPVPLLEIMEVNPKLTERQREAVQSDAFPIAVRAGAGSGKTMVLVERYVRLVLDKGILPHRILAATFTEKAAAQMKERVAEKLSEAGREELMAELNAAPISTLHSFCSRLITPLALDLGLDPGYRILDSHEALLLQEATLTQVLSRWRAQNPEKIRTMVKHLTWSGDYGLRRGRTPTSRGFTKQFLDLVEAARSAGTAGNSPFTEIQVDEEENRRQVEAAISTLDALLWDTDPKRAQKSQEKALEARKLLNRYRDLGETQGQEELEILGKLRGIKLNVSAEFKETLRTIREELTPLLFDQHYQPAYQSVQVILNRLYSEFLENYDARKRDIGALDFLDLEEIALKILRSGVTRKPVDYVLIDEAQDFNPVQWEIVSLLGQDAPVFAVGDAQQSIYGFRYADVSLFAGFTASATDLGGCEIPLKENFRSRESILGVVNRLFGDLWKESAPNLFLELLGEYPYPRIENDEVELMIATASDRQKAREIEARHLAHQLRELVQAGWFKVHREMGIADAGTPCLQPETPKWSDILVLVRSGSSFEPLERAFKDLSVPFVMQAGRGFWDELEISDLMALLRALEDPGDSFNMACLLRCPAAGFDDDDLVELLYESTADTGTSNPGNWRRRSIYEGLRSTADANAPEDSLPRRAAAFLLLFDRLFCMKDRVPLRRVLETWIDETNLESHWSLLHNGHLIRANIRKFLRLCDAHAGEPASKLRAAFDEIRLRDLHEGGAPLPRKGEGAVTVMTVHGAKGLEAPIVVLFDMNHSAKGRGDAFVFSRHSGAAFCITPDANKVDRYTPQIFESIKDEVTSREKRESERVLYVAMTRAREKLILTASCALGQEGPKKVDGWFKMIIEHLGLSRELLITSSAPPDSIPVPLLDSQGRATGIKLMRVAGDLAPSTVPSSKASLAKNGASLIPDSFPAQPQPGLGPVSVVEWLHGQKGGSARTSTSEYDEDIHFDGSETGKGVSLGRWVHRLLQNLPEDPCSVETRREAAQREALLLFGVKPAENEVTDVLRLMDRYVQSDLAQRVSVAQKVLREYPLLFSLDRIMLRGKIDLAFQDKSGWTLVDYKSDRRPPADDDERAGLYRLQLTLYALGWQKITGQLPTRAILFYLQTGEQRSVPLQEQHLNAAKELFTNLNN